MCVTINRILKNLLIRETKLRLYKGVAGLTRFYVSKIWFKKSIGVTKIQAQEMTFS